jgi:hypothetical protein
LHLIAVDAHGDRIAIDIDLGGDDTTIARSIIASIAAR